jgi:putative ABC transport system permease protein
MTLATLVREAVTALRLNALRSALTAIGVIIGVAGIIVLGAASGGANRKIEDQINAMGADDLVIAPIKVENAGQRGPVVLLTDEDAKAIEEHIPAFSIFRGKLTVMSRSQRETRAGLPNTGASTPLMPTFSA